MGAGRRSMTAGAGSETLADGDNGGGSGPVGPGDAANWSQTGTRYYALDPDTGDDGDIGYSDVSMALAGAVAKKTWTGINGLRSIIPLLGAGRQIVVAIKPRASGATIAENFNWDGYVGYRSIIIEATTDFSDTTADRVIAGAVVASAGPGVGGLWTAAAGSTTSLVVLNALQTMPAETAIIGYRVRFTGNVTGALLNAVANISTVTAGLGGSLVPGFNLPAAPAVGDTFYIEKEGVAFQAIRIAMDGASVSSGIEALNTQNGYTVKGLASTTNTATTAFAVVGPGRRMNLGFCSQRGTTAICSIDNVGEFRCLHNTVRTQTGSAINVGVGMRIDGTFSMYNCPRSVMHASSYVTAANRPTFISCPNLGALGVGSYMSGGATIDNCGAYPPQQSQLNGYDSTGGTNFLGRGSLGATTRVPRIIATSGVLPGLFVKNSSIQIYELAISGMGALPALGVSGLGVSVSIDGVTGSTGNTGVGIDLQHLASSKVHLTEAVNNSVTGTAGDIKLAGSVFGIAPTVIATHASFFLTNVVDIVGNNIQGDAGHVVDACTLYINKSGGAMVLGNVLRSDLTNTTPPQMLNAQADTQAKATAVMGVSVTEPANDAAGYMATSGRVYLAGAVAPTVGAIVYLDDANAGKGTATVPPVAATNQKLRLGYAVETAGATNGYTAWQPELIPVLSDGVAP